MATVCEWRNEDGSACTNEPTGSVGIVVNNNPLPGKETIWIATCEFHNKGLDKLRHK